MSPILEKEILTKIKKLEENDNKLERLVWHILKRQNTSQQSSVSDLYGILKGKISDQDIEEGIKKARTEWLKELEQFK